MNRVQEDLNVTGFGLNNTQLGEDAGACVGTFPPSGSEIRAIPDFLDNSSFLTDDAQRNLSASREYQSLLGQMNALAGDVVAKSIQREFREPFLNDMDQVPTANVPALEDSPSTGRKRASRFGQIISVAKKRPLDVSARSNADNPLRGDVLFQGKYAKLVSDLLEEISLRPVPKSFSNDDVQFAAYILVRAGLTSVTEIKLALPLNRKYLLRDLRDEDLSRVDLLFSLKVFETFPPTIKFRNAKHPEFEEICGSSSKVGPGAPPPPSLK